MDGTEKENRICASCGETANSLCGKCTMTWYCEAACQKKAWPMHKITCGKTGIDLIVHRAGQLLQDVYLLMREHTFEYSIESVEDQGDHLAVRLNEMNEMIPGPIYAFPNHLVRNKKERKMILTAGRCEQPQAFLHEFLKEMLSDADVRLEEHTLQMKVPSKIVRFEAHFGTHDSKELNHSVVVVKSSENALSWIMDVTGAQYGIFDICLPEATYRKRHVAATIAAHESGLHNAFFKAIIPLEGYTGLLARIGWHAAKEISTAISDWKTQSNLSLPELLRKDEGNFVKERMELIEAIKASLENNAADVDGKFKADIKDTDDRYERKKEVGLCPRQELADVMTMIDQAYRLY